MCRHWRAKKYMTGGEKNICPSVGNWSLIVKLYADMLIIEEVGKLLVKI
jgi:hypothetical protein